MRGHVSRRRAATVAEKRKVVPTLVAIPSVGDDPHSDEAEKPLRHSDWRESCTRGASSSEDRFPVDVAASRIGSCIRASEEAQREVARDFCLASSSA